MKKLISSNEVVDFVTDSSGRREVCAKADASYDEESSLLVVQLESCVRPVGGAGCVREGWLPGTETVKESVPLAEATSVARDVFRTWVAKVRKAILNSNLQTL